MHLSNKLSVKWFIFNYFYRKSYLNQICDLNSFDPNEQNVVAKPFWMTKLILVNTTFIDLGDIILLCMTLWILCKMATISGAKKPKVSKQKWYKNVLIVKTHSLVFGHFAWSSFEGCMFLHKSHGSQSHKWWNLIQINTCMFSSYPHTP